MNLLQFEIPENEPALFDTWPLADQRDAGSVTDVDLYYRLFLVRARFVASGVEFISPTGTVTLFSLASSAVGSVLRLRDGLSGGLGLPESPEVIEFRPDGAEVVIRSSLLPLTAVVGRTELIACLIAFVNEAHRAIVSHWAALAENEDVAGLKKDVAEFEIG
ncbi:hypothetical protein ACTOB_001978 [Actinoplanes oblitus]|uniref:AraC family transcriptional regulator n=1 Tax=Actinoplanes oblitus TaxID=3040509 RepID=A0ABY8WKG5_9ACTN|nr:hypothetical protein [Actinoplanes oblitus]WIM98379.1 hypothetical protein ACTOB_001978 [Actinoplanes oblitus]